MKNDKVDDKKVYDRMMKWAYFLSKRKDEAEDVVQDFSLKVLRSSYETYPSYHAFKNHFIQYFRKRGNRRESHELIENMYDYDLEEKLLKKEAVDKLNIAINKLSEKQQEVVRLFYFEGKTYQEIMEILEIEETTLKGRLERARESLKFKLDEYMKAA